MTPPSTPPGPLPPGAVLTPMHAGSDQGSPVRPLAGRVGSGGRQQRQPPPSKPNQTNYALDANRDGRSRSRDRFSTINTFVDVTMRLLSDRAALAWFVLWRDTKPNGVARTAVADLARRMGCSPSTAKRALAELRMKNLVVVTDRGGLGKGPSSYRLPDIGRSAQDEPAEVPRRKRTRGERSSVPTATRPHSESP